MIHAPSGNGINTWTRTVIHIRTSLHPSIKPSPGLSWRKFNQEEEEAGEVSYKAPLVFLKVLVLENILQQCGKEILTWLW